MGKTGNENEAEKQKKKSKRIQMDDAKTKTEKSIYKSNNEKIQKPVNNLLRKLLKLHTKKTQVMRTIARGKKSQRTFGVT